MQNKIQPELLSLFRKEPARLWFVKLIKWLINPKLIKFS